MTRRVIVRGLAAAIVSAALGACGSASKQPTTATGPATGSVVAAPVQSAQTKFGTVAYRVVGSGPPLVLIMGYAGTMATWDPRFVDALAEHFRVIVFDNAGVGNTQSLPAPLTIDAMADQTSALIETLKLGRVNVLGWSMGGMIAQALAIRHPAAVRRLVLCATFAGTGTVARPSQAAINALTGGSRQKLIDDLFPADETMAYYSFAAGTSSYPTTPPAPASAVKAQAHAVLEWWNGTDPAGRRTATISVPTLVADGTVDQIDPVSNDHILARAIPGARLVLYPNAGHAFLFQEGAPFTFLVQSFLTGAPRPLSVTSIRRRFLAEEAAATSAGRSWASRLGAAGSHATAAQLLRIDQPFAAALTKLDSQLLEAGATGRVGSAVTPFVKAGEAEAEDIMALAVQNASTVRAWGAALKKDSDRFLETTNALREALGLKPVHVSAGTTSPSA